MAEQKPTGYYQSPYKFNGKELDEETGLYYYGARYYDPKASNWLSVDPLAEQFQGVNPYVYCLENPVVLIDPDGCASVDTKSPIFDSKTGAYLGNDSEGFNKGEVLFMTKDKFNALTKAAGGGKIKHSVAVKNSISISKMSENKENIVLFNKASDFISKTLYKHYYGMDPTNELLGNRVETYSSELGLGTGNAEALSPNDYGGHDKVSDTKSLITNNFDNRDALNTAPNIFSNFEHEFRGHGGKVNFNIKYPRSSPYFKIYEHKAIYQMQMNSPNFQYVNGRYEQSVKTNVEFYNSYK